MITRTHRFGVDPIQPPAGAMPERGSREGATTSHHPPAGGWFSFFRRIFAEWKRDLRTALVASCDNHPPGHACEMCSSPRGFYVGDVMHCKDCLDPVTECGCLSE